MVVCGPGARNANIMSYIRSEFSDTTIRTTDDARTAGLSASEAAVAIAQHALDAVLRAYTVVSDTLQSAVATGEIAPGKRWAQTVEQVMRFGDGKPLPTVQPVSIDRVSDVRLSLAECTLYGEE